MVGHGFRTAAGGMLAKAEILVMGAAKASASGDLCPETWTMFQTLVVSPAREAPFCGEVLQNDGNKVLAWNCIVAPLYPWKHDVLCPSNHKQSQVAFGYVSIMIK